MTSTEQTSGVPGPQDPSAAGQPTAGQPAAGDAGLVPMPMPAAQQPGKTPRTMLAARAKTKAPAKAPTKTKPSTNSKRRGRAAAAPGPFAFGSPAAAAAATATPSKTPKTARPKTSKASTMLVGLEPRVDLLPAEVHGERRERAIARRAWLGVVLLVVVAGLGTAGASIAAAQSRDNLTTAQTAGAAILQGQLKYTQVRQVQRQTTLLQAAQAVGGSSEIDWSKYLLEVAGALPTSNGGAEVTSLTVTAMNPTAAATQSDDPLANARVASVSATISSAAVLSVPDLTDNLQKIPGLTNVAIQSISSGNGTGGKYTSQVTFDLTEKAFDNTYKAKG